VAAPHLACRAAGGARATAVLAVLGYRVVSYWLPLLPGAVAYLRLRLTASTSNLPNGVLSRPVGKAR